MLRYKFFKKLFISSNNIKIKRFSSSAIDIEKLEKDSTNESNVVDDDIIQKEALIQAKRNKSRLKEHHRNIVNETIPYAEPIYDYQETLKYKRRMYGTYGSASGINPALCWPVEDELNNALEYEKIAYPFTIPQMIEDSRQKKQEKIENIRLRQEEIIKRISKLEDWKQNLALKIQKKENESTAAKERKERLMEEVRAHFGYTVDPKDDKFKAMLEQKEKEQKKALKAARKKERQENLINRLLSQKTDKSEKTKE